MKKMGFLIVLLAFITAGVQLFDGRDFSQVSLAWDKYYNGGEISSFFSDIVIIFKGERVKEATLPLSKYANQIMYRWTDDAGVMHVSERRPDVEKYEEIRIGDLKLQIQPGLSNKQIEQVLKTEPKD